MGASLSKTAMARFRRVTESLVYIPEVDGLRFVAIASVFIFHLAGDVIRHSPPSYKFEHATEPLFWLTQRLNLGVQLFFVISGFVLGLPFAQRWLGGGLKPINLKRYYLRRLTRLEPPYLIALICFFFLKLAAGRDTAASLFGHLAASCVYLHNQIYGRPSDINFVSWSLEIEVQFYLLAPLLTFALFRIQRPKLRWAILLASCAGAGVLALAADNSARLNLSLLGQAPFFLAGLGLADIYVSTKEAPGQRHRWDLAAAFGAGAVFACLKSQSSWLFLSPIAIAFTYLAALRGQRVKALLGAPVIATIGGMCYSIYLVHNYVIAIAGNLTEHFTRAAYPFAERLLVQASVLAPITLVVSAVFFLLIEKPCMRPDWPSRLALFLRVGPVKNQQVYSPAQVPALME